MRQVAGIHACLEVLRVRPRKISTAFLKRDWAQNSELKVIKDELSRERVRIKEVHPQELDKITAGHQGVVFEVNESPELNLGPETRLILGLDGVEDPQNLGSILRTSWLMGVQGLYILKSRAVGLTPTVCKVASGGAEHVPVDEVNQLIEPIEILKEKGFWVYGLSEKADKTLWDIEFPEKVVLIAGAEEKGLKPQTLKACDDLISIPQIDPSASLNVAISVAVGLSEIQRQWRPKS